MSQRRALSAGRLVRGVAVRQRWQRQNELEAITIIMTPGFEFVLFAIAFATSALGRILGTASGIFIVPALSLFARVDIHAAIGASVVSVIACSCAAAASFLRARLTNIRLAIVLEVATTLGTLTGVLLSAIRSTSTLLNIHGGFIG